MNPGTSYSSACLMQLAHVAKTTSIRCWARVASTSRAHGEGFRLPRPRSKMLSAVGLLQILQEVPRFKLTAHGFML